MAVIPLQLTTKQFFTIRIPSCEKLNVAIHKTTTEFCPPFYQKYFFLITCPTTSPLFWVSSSHAAQTLSKFVIMMQIGQIPAVCASWPDVDFFMSPFSYPWLTENTSSKSTCNTTEVKKQRGCVFTLCCQGMSELGPLSKQSLCLQEEQNDWDLSPVYPKKTQ